jgi:parallel beta-helix repeat protein
MLGWLADFSDADDFAVPFMASWGAFTEWQAYSNSTIDNLLQYEESLSVAPVNNTSGSQYQLRNAALQQLQADYIQNAISLPTDQPLGRHWSRDWVYGYYVNQLYPGLYYQDLYKSDLWPMFHHDLTHTGYSASTGPTTNQTLWTYTTGNEVGSSPAVVGGVVYVGSYDHKVYALNATTGALIWNYTTGNLVESSPAVSGGVVFVGSDDGNLYAFDAATGALKWNYTTGNYVESSPVISGGVVYVGSWDGNIYALDAGTGALEWNYTTAGNVGYSSPAVVGGVVYVGSEDDEGILYALDATTGALKWSYATGPVYSSPAVSGGFVYVGSSGVYALDASTGALNWSYITGGYVYSSPAVSGSVVYVGSDDGNIYGLNAYTGARIWNYTTGGPVDSSPAVSGGLVYVCSYDGNVYAFSPPGSQTRYSWPMFQHDITHTGYTESPAPLTNNTMWTYTTGSELWSSPAVADGMVYVGSYYGKIYCLDASTGALVWNYSAGVLYSSPAVSGGLVYVGSDDWNVYALDASTGALKWNYTTGGQIESSPAVAGSMVYVGSEDGKVYCLDASTGALVWSYTTGGGVGSSPAVAGGMVYVGSMDNKVYALNATTGLQVWNYTTGNYVISSPAVVGGVVYVGSYDDNVYALNATTGAFIWSYTTGGYVASSPAVAGGMVYVGSGDGKVYCLDASTGALKWNYTTGGYVVSSPAVAGGMVYVGSYDNRTYCLDASTGALVWSYTTGGPVESSPAISDGMVFIGSNDCTLYAFGEIISTENYTTVQAAINAAPSGATVLVAPGTYSQPLIINKTLTILGMLGSEPTFNGGGTGIAITIVPSGSGSTIAGIAITSWTQGIVVNGASDCNIYDNIVSLINQNGIVVQGSNASNNLVYDNIFEQDDIAVSLTSSTSNNTITGNMISLSSIGLNIQASGNIVYANIMTYNVVAINITNSNNNLFFHNDFISSTFQLNMSNSTGNVWDNGYPSGGNYWSDYLTQNPNATENGSSGIWNTPYVIANGSVDYYPLVTPFSLHNIGIASLVLSKTVIGHSYTSQMSLKILDLGTYDETFTVTVCANSTLITQQTISLSSGDYTTLTLTWNTADCTMGNYTISAIAGPVLGQVDTSDNNRSSLVLVTIPGDINGDGTVNILDAVLLANAFLSTPGSPNWNPNADINGDGIVNILDAIILANHFGMSIT